MSRHQEHSEATRKKLLEAGAELYREKAAADPFKNLALAEVAERAGVSRNALAYHWRTKEDYSAALAEHLLRWTGAFDEFFEATRNTVDATQDEPALSRILRLAEMDLAGLKDDPAWIASEILTLVYAPLSDTASAAASAGYRVLDEFTWTHLYGRLLDSLDRELRPPLTPEAFAIIMQALVEGAGIRQLFDAEAVAGSDSEVGNFALAAATLCIGLSRPRRSSDDRSVLDLLEGELRGD